MKLSAQHEANGITIIVGLPSTGEYLHIRFEKNETKKYASVMFGDRSLEGEFTIRPVKIDRDEDQDLELVFSVINSNKKVKEKEPVIVEKLTVEVAEVIEKKVDLIDENEVLPPPVKPPEEPDLVILEEKVSVNTELVMTEQERELFEEEVKPKPPTKRRR